MKNKNLLLPVVLSSLIIIQLLTMVVTQSIIFSSGFEHPILDEWSGTQTNYGVNSLSQIVLHHGTASLESKVTSSNGYAFVYKVISPQNPANARAYFKLNRLPSDGKKYSLITFEKSGWGCPTTISLINESGTLKWSLRYYTGSPAYMFSEASIPGVGAWFCLELKHGLGAQLHVNGTEILSVTGSEQNVDQVGFGLHYADNAKYDPNIILHTDCVIISSTYIGCEEEPPTQPQTGTLIVDSSPVKGEAFVDDLSWGLCPQSRTLTTGTYTVSWGEVTGYTKPQDQIVDLENEILTVSGTYTSIPSPEMLTDYWGNLFFGVKGSSYGQASYATLTSSTDLGSVRSSAEIGGTITQVDLCMVIHTGGEFKVGIQRDNSGNPNGVWEGETIVDLYCDCPENDNYRWYKIPIDNVPVTQGEVFHIVVEPQQPVNVECMGMAPNNKLHPYQMWQDDSLTGMYNEGNGWMVRDDEHGTAPYVSGELTGISPTYVVTYADNKREGQPYHTSWDGMHIYQDMVHGQMVRYTQWYRTVDRIGFRIARRGSMNEDLLLNVWDVTDSPINLICNLVFATPSEVPVDAWGQWIERNVEMPVVYGRKYQMLFSTESGDFDNSWVVMTQGAFGPTDWKDPGAYRVNLNFDGRESCKLEGENVPPKINNLFPPDDLPFYWHLTDVFVSGFEEPFFSSDEWDGWIRVQGDCELTRTETPPYPVYGGRYSAEVSGMGWGNSRMIYKTFPEKMEEVYVRTYVYFPELYTYPHQDTGETCYWIYFLSIVPDVPIPSASNNPAYPAMVSGYLRIYYDNQLDRYVFTGSKYDGTSGNRYYIPAGTNLGAIEAGRWYYVEWYHKIASAEGVADGIWRLYIDDLTMGDSHIYYEDNAVPNYEPNAPYFGALLLGNYETPGSQNPETPTPTMYFDEVIVNNQYIGPSSNPPRPCIESCDSLGTIKHTYAFPEAVYITGNGYDCSTTIPLYVVSNVQTWTDGMTIPPRVPNTETTVSSDSSGNIVATIAWSQSIPGEYDVVVDVNGNGKYDECIDALDDKDIEVTTAGFFVISEYKFGTILALTICLFGFGVYTKRISKRHRR